MNSMAIGGYKNVDVANPRGGYQKPSVVTTPILDHKYGYYVGPNRVAFKYPKFKKDIDLDIHVRMLNFAI
jgi:hypothetical protein